LIKNIVTLIEKINEANQNQSSEVERINVAVQELAVYINKTADLARSLDYAINNLTFDENV
jgi:methyl-accepting chemotaxis protein